MIKYNMNDDINKLKRHIKDLHYFTDSHAFYRLEIELSITFNEADISNVVFAGGHGYTNAKITIKGQEYYISDEVVSGLLLSYWDRKLHNF